MNERRRKSEDGAALVALLALMTIMAIIMLGAAPSISQQIQRERELEAIRRGDEIALAIVAYIENKGQYPKSMKDLLEGVNDPGRTKKRMILRPSAAIDPLSENGEWITIQTNENQKFAQFAAKLTAYTGVRQFNHLGNQRMQSLLSQPGSPGFAAVNTVLDVETSDDTDPPGGESDADSVEGPFIGVMSRSQRKSVRTFYGIGRHDRWIFTPLFRGSGNNQAVINNNFNRP